MISKKKIFGWANAKMAGEYISTSKAEVPINFLGPLRRSPSTRVRVWSHLPSLPTTIGQTICFRFLHKPSQRHHNPSPKARIFGMIGLVKMSSILWTVGWLKETQSKINLEAKCFSLIKL